MALKATIFKVELAVADLDRNVYENFSLTLAQHPSENDARMMVRLLAFMLFADERLEFGRGISSDDEPDLWLKDLTGAIELWIEVGQPDDKRLMKACGRSERVIVYSYSATSHIRYKQIANKLDRAKNLTVINIPADASAQLEALAQRNMQLQCTIQDGQIYLTDSVNTVLIEREDFKALR